MQGKTSLMGSRATTQGEGSMPGDLDRIQAQLTKISQSILGVTSAVGELCELIKQQPHSQPRERPAFSQALSVMRGMAPRVLDYSFVCGIAVGWRNNEYCIVISVNYSPMAQATFPIDFTEERKIIEIYIEKWEVLDPKKPTATSA